MRIRNVVVMASTSSGSGYWLATADGGIFAYNAPFLGSTGSIALNKPIVGLEANADGIGYRFSAADGGVFTYGTFGFFGTPIFAPHPFPHPAPTPGANSPACLIYVSNSAPPDSYEETVTITSNQPNAPVSLIIHYSRGTSIVSGMTDGTGEAATSFNIGGAASSYPVNVDAVVGNASCGTGFTPL